jgi:hypothetical protein
VQAGWANPWGDQKESKSQYSISLNHLNNFRLPIVLLNFLFLDKSQVNPNGNQARY